MMFKRMMFLGALASALAFAGCQDRNQQDQENATGGSGSSGVLGPWGGQPGNVGTPSGSDTSGDIGGSGDMSGTGDIGGSVGDQGGTVAPDGMDGTDDPALDEKSQGTDEGLDRGGEIR